jgi:hypothetical protein
LGLKDLVVDYCKYFSPLGHLLVSGMFANSYLLQGPGQQIGQYSDRNTEHEGNIHPREVYNDGSKNYEVSSVV